MSTFANQRDPSAAYFSSPPETYLLNPLHMYVSTLMELLKVLFGQVRPTFANQRNPGATYFSSPEPLSASSTPHVCLDPREAAESVI